MLFYTSKCIGCRLCESRCSRNAHSFEGLHSLDRAVCVACGACAYDCPTGALSLCGKDYTVAELVAQIEKDRAFYGKGGGGVTLSGGEPLMQGESVITLLQACKEFGLSTVLETCGFADTEWILSAIPYIDLFLWDVKDTDRERHMAYTGVSNKKILDNLALADAHGAKTRLRCILINGINTHEEHYQKIAEIASSLSNCEGVEFIPYHAYGGTKATFLGREDSGKQGWIPTPQQVARAKEVLASAKASQT